MNVDGRAQRFSQGRKRRGIWLRILAAMCCVVVFVTTYMLILPAITMENQTETNETGGEAPDAYALVCMCDSSQGDSPNAMLNTAASTSGRMGARAVTYTEEDGEYVIYSSDTDLAVWNMYKDEDCTEQITEVTESTTAYIATEISGVRKFLKVDDGGNQKQTNNITLSNDACSVYLSTVFENTSIADGWFCIFEDEAGYENQYGRVFLSEGKASNGFNTFYGQYQLQRGFFRLMTVKEKTIDPADYPVDMGAYFMGCTYANPNTAVLNSLTTAYNYSNMVACTDTEITVDSGTAEILVEEEEYDEAKEKYEVWTIYGAAGAAGADGAGITESGIYLVTTQMDGETCYLNVTGNFSNAVVLTTAPAALYITVLDTGEVTFSNVVWNRAAWEAGSYSLYVYSSSNNKSLAGSGSDNNLKKFVLGKVQVQVYPTVDGANPAGTIVNLFDYWTTTQWPEGGDFSEDNTQIAGSGINAGRTLKFSTCTNMETNGYGAWNKSNGDKSYAGLMEKLTGDDGYPVLTDQNVSFDTADEADGFSAAYLFNPNVKSDYKAAYTNVSGLFQKAENSSYYYYDSSENFARYNESTNSFTLYSEPMSGEWFFPFNSFGSVKSVTSSSSSVLNHYFGVSITDRFQIFNGGYTDEERTEPMTFEFTGDDDVWIFIDGVLVADLGGIHNSISVTINFATGEIKYSWQGSDTTLQAQFETAGEMNSVEWSEDGATFADGSFHTLSFFYLERGNYASNLKIKYNLTSANTVNLFKVDQYGDALAGAAFALYATDENYSYYTDDGEVLDLAACDSYSVDGETGVITAEKDGAAYTVTPKHTGTTDATGELILLNKWGAAYTARELRSLTGEHFIMREYSVPAGYRTVADEILFYWDSDYLFCDNVYESGAFSRVGAITTATSNLYKAGSVGENGSYDDETIDYYKLTSDEAANGTLFAVVLKKNGATGDVDSWYPVTGSSDNGYSVATDNSLAAAIAAAQSYGEERVFTRQSNNKYAVNLTDLPGVISEYYTYRQYVMGRDYNHTDCMAQSEYYIAYYWSSAASLAGATADNTVRVVSRGDVVQGYDGFEYDIGAVISITNMENRVYLYKMDKANNYIENAVFALYPAGEDESGALYYAADDGTKIYLDADEDGDNAGTAHISSPAGTAGSYRISTENIAVRDEAEGLVTGENAGVITVAAEDSVTYTVSPVKNAQNKAQVAYTHMSCGYGYNSDGATGHFTLLSAGSYVTREIWAPAGFLLNAAEVRTLITENAVYADAGTAGDGVVVGKGAGYLASTLHAVASDGNIEETLRWIYALLEKTGSEHGFAALLENEAHTVSTDSFWQYGISAGDAMTKDDETTADKAASIVTYLEYDNDTGTAIFNYIANDDFGESGTAATGVQWTRDTGTGVKSRRLWTDTGWSYMALYQDYKYGAATTTTTTTSYLNLYDDGVETYGADGEISNLFSRSTYIAVTDGRYVDLEIEKVSAQTGGTLAGAEFYLYKLDEDSNPLYYSYADGAARWVESVEDATRLSTGEAGEYAAAEVYGLAAGTYYLRETQAPAGYYALTGDIEVTVTDSGGWAVQIRYNGVDYTGAPNAATAWGVAQKTVTDSGGQITESYAEKWVLTVPNYTGERLPDTGGGGAYALYAAAGVLLFGSAAVIFIKKRLAERGRSP